MRTGHLTPLHQELKKGWIDGRDMSEPKEVQRAL
jgi:hypothetical protein